MSDEEDEDVLDRTIREVAGDFWEQPLWRRVRAEAKYKRDGVPDNSPTLLLALCPRCPGRLGTVRGTEDGPLFLGKVVLEATDSHGVLRLPVVKLLRRPPEGMPDPDRLPVSCVGEGSCHGRYVLLRHEVLQLANHRNTRKWRPAGSFLVGWHAPQNDHTLRLTWPTPLATDPERVRMAMPGLTPAERSLRASIAAHTRWSNTPSVDRRRQADRGHAALLEKFAAQVDPDGRLTPGERDKLARNAYAAHMKRLAFACSRARRGAA